MAMAGPASGPSSPPFEGLWNLRDLGGLPVKDGGQTRRRRLFRSGTLWFATMADCNRLAALRLDSCIDLRLPQEEAAEDDWLCELLDLRYYHLPIGLPAEPNRLHLLHPAGPTDYLAFLHQNATRYIRALQLISDDDNHPLLFHDAAGVDRTGVLAALVLACLGVTADAIVDDYLASSAGLPPILDRYRDHKLYGPAAAAADGHQVDAGVMREFLAACGGVDGLRDWAIDNGLKDTAIENLRTALLEQ
jgi:protein-tyrosine phosphatase